MRIGVVFGLGTGPAAVCVAQPPQIELYATRGSEFQPVDAPYAFDVTARDFRPVLHGFGGAPVNTIDTSAAAVMDTLYVWGRCLDAPDHAQIQCRHLVVEVAGEIGPMGENAMCRHRTPENGG